jgi:ElaB/YqjD/DUF883 family membrane-anchored ribosome-binding protein
MTLNTDLSHDKTRAWGEDRTAALKAKAADVAEHARIALDETSRKARSIARTTGVRAQDAAARTAEEARRHPVATSLIVAAIGIGLFLLTNRRARAAIYDAGERGFKAIDRETRNLPFRH